MKHISERGRPLLTAAIELLTDVPTQVMVSAFRAAADNPREAGDAAHYQGVVWRALKPLFQDGLLVAIGFANGAEEPKAIHPQFFDSAIPDLVRSTLTSHGVSYAAVRVFEAENRPLAQASPEPVLKGKGGRTPVHDWKAFTKEVVRSAWKGEFLDRRELTAHMRQWCAVAWSNPPGDEAIRVKVAELCPDGPDGIPSG